MVIEKEDSTVNKLDEYLELLDKQEKSLSTRTQYKRSLRRFLFYTCGQELDKETVIAYKEELRRHHAPGTVNGNLAAINGYLDFLGRWDLRVKQLKVQRAPYLPQDKELDRADYFSLIQTAEDRGDRRTSLILQTLCSTGIRVSELSFITVEAVTKGQARVELKGKCRVVLLPSRLRELLRGYARAKRLRSGPIFVTKGGKPVDRSNIWRSLRSLCDESGVDPKKVYPHNLRHLFARCFYEEERDLAKLADVLGHSSVNTTRIYVKTSGREQQEQVDRLNLTE